MKTFTLLAVLPAALIWGAVAPQPEPQQQEVRAGSGWVMIESPTGHPERWVKLAYSGHQVKGMKNLHNPGLVHLDFEEPAPTRILVNLEKIDWMVVSGESLGIQELAPVPQGSLLEAKRDVLRLSGLERNTVAEVAFDLTGKLVSMNGPEDYLLQADAMLWASLPQGSKIEVIE